MDGFPQPEMKAAESERLRTGRQVHIRDFDAFMAARGGEDR
jgi:hypothetical protein